MRQNFAGCEHFVWRSPVQIEYCEKLLFFEKAAVNVDFGRRFCEAEKFSRLGRFFLRKTSCFFINSLNVEFFVKKINNLAVSVGGGGAFARIKVQSDLQFVKILGN